MDPAVQAIYASGKLEPFVRYIRFPFYKNIMPGTKIDFLYPLTALVGINGSNKSSRMKALYGCPGGSNVGELWFSTKIDPIVETDGEGRNRFIYGYLNKSTQNVVEVIKTRIKKEEDPDYWEPSRPLTSDGMAKMPDWDEKILGRSRTRWDAITKNVVLIDFRQILSAFDKAFYHYDTHKASGKNRKNWIRARSSILKKLIDSNAPSSTFYGRERLHENRALQANEIDAINGILGKNYKSIRVVKHSYFDTLGYTCILQSGDLVYSEAFAGSGEFAVVMLVIDILGAPAKSLILLDEPEVSLHPGAQGKLIDFLFHQIKTKKHQVVIATHSPALIRNLPPEAIKVFIHDETTGKICLPSQTSYPEVAFFHIGEPATGRKTIVVEDALAAELIKRAKRLIDPALASIIDVKFFPGGAETLWGFFVPTYAAESRQNLMVLFDGDKRPAEPFADPATIPEADNGKLGALIKAVTGVAVQFNPDGSKGVAKPGQRAAMERQFIGWSRSHTRYLPGAGNPEDLLWNLMPDNEEKRTAIGNDAKERFASLAHSERGFTSSEKVDGQMILETQIRVIAKLQTTHAEMSEICTLIQDFASQ